MVNIKRVLFVALLAWAAATAAWLLRRRADHAAPEWAGPGPVHADAVGGTAEDLHAPGTPAPR